MTGVEKLLPHVVLRAPARGSDPGWFMSINGIELLGVRSASVQTQYDGMTLVRLEFHAHVNTLGERDEPEEES